MAQPSDRAMRDLIRAEVRLAVANYFLPARLIAHLAGRAARFVTGRPGAGGRPASHAWWRSA